MPTAPGRPGTAQLTVASSRAKHAHETLPVGHYTPQEARQAFAEAVVKAHGLTGAASTCAALLSASLEGLLLVPPAMGDADCDGLGRCQFVTASMARPSPSPVMYKIPEVMAMLRMSRHAVYAQIRRGRLRIVNEGRATFVTPAAITAYVELLEREAEAGSR